MRFGFASSRLPAAHFALVIALAACGDDITGPPDDTNTGVQLVEVASGFSFPVLVTSPLEDLTRLFVVEKGGLIRIIRNGQLLSTPFLDIRNKVSRGGEQGLLGLAFHHDYADNRVFVINYTDTDGNTHVSSLKTSSNPDVADPASEETFLFVDQPFANHNGGHVTFGPFGYLFVGLGDGGSAGDPGDRAQNLATPLGKILRYQVDDNGHVTIPNGNPFVGNPGLIWGIWSAGLRNPWRFSFDRLTSDLYIGDVGQNRFEEIDVVAGTAGFGRAANFGWNIMEGNECYSPSSGCNMMTLVRPLVVYGHSDGCSVTGGHVYRGDAVPSIRGVYFYSDYCSGWIRSFRYENGVAVDQKEWPELDPGDNVTSFGEDGRGELYVVTSGGRILRFAPGE
ncbi:MAG TPA: PQQ-dependent sugar dehydrogenase [Gemmatimonadales bacterium]|nr:PQQ-dependent sugar dehydrogenase [Gemmatimonadales bacterium]